MISPCPYCDGPRSAYDPRELDADLTGTVKDAVYCPACRIVSVTVTLAADAAHEV